MAIDMFKNHVVGGSVGISYIYMYTYLKINICVRCLSFPYFNPWNLLVRIWMETMLIHIKQIIHEGASRLLCSTKTEKNIQGHSMNNEVFSDSRVAYFWKTSCYSNQSRLIVCPIISRSFIHLRRKNPRCVTRESHKKGEKPQARRWDFIVSS